MKGLGQQAVPGAQSPQARALAADLDHLGTQVTPENVLQVRNVLKAEANRLAKVLSTHGYLLRVDLCGGDPVSRDARDGFNAKLDRLKAQFQGYVDALRGAAGTLERTAAAYGYTEQEIRDSFPKPQTTPTPPPTGPSPQPPPTMGLQPPPPRTAPPPVNTWIPLMPPELGPPGGQR